MTYRPDKDGMTPIPLITTAGLRRTREFLSQPHTPAEHEQADPAWPGTYCSHCTKSLRMVEENDDNDR